MNSTKKTDLKETFSRAKAQFDSLNSSIMESIRAFLKTRPDRTASLVDNTAYCLVQGCEAAYETPVYGVRLNEHDDIEISLDTDCEDEYPFNQKPDWSREAYVKSPEDHYITFNWISLLEALSYVKD